MIRLSTLLLLLILISAAQAADVLTYWRPGSGDYQQKRLLAVPGYVLSINEAGEPVLAAPAGTGDVVGPNSSVSSQLAAFNGASGKLLIGAGYSATELRARGNHTGTQAAGTITGLAASATTDTTSATNITAGTLPDGRLSANIPRLNQGNVFTGRQMSANDTLFPGFTSSYTGGRASSFWNGSTASVITFDEAGQLLFQLGSNAAIQTGTGAGSYVGMIKNDGRWGVSYSDAATTLEHALNVNGATQTNSIYLKVTHAGLFSTRLNPATPSSDTTITIPSRTGTMALTDSISHQAMLNGISITQGALLYRGFATWDALTPGTAGQVLQTGGAAANPSWVSVAGALTPWTQNIDGATFDLTTGGDIQAASLIGDHFGDLSGTTNVPAGELQGTTPDALVFGKITTSRSNVNTPVAGVSNVIVTSDAETSIVLVAATVTLTYSDEPPTGTYFRYTLEGHTVDCLVTIPSTYSFAAGGLRTTFTALANRPTSVVVRRGATRYVMWGDPMTIGDLPLDATPATSAKIEIDQGSGSEHSTVADIVAAAGSVLGPASAVTARIATYNGTTGKLLQDGGSTVANVLARANHTGTQASGTITGLATSATTDTTSATNITTGTLPDGRFPNTLPVASGINLTALNASNIASGTIGASRLGTGTANSSTILRGDLTWATPAAGTKTINRFRPLENEPPTTAFATLDTRNSRPVLDFDTTTAEAAVWTSIIPEGTVLTDGLTVLVWCSAATATSGTIGWDVAFERLAEAGLDTDTDSFGTIQTITAATVSGTSGILDQMSVTFTQAQLPASLAVGEMFRLRLRRDVANDTAAGDAEVHAVEIRVPSI